MRAFNRPIVRPPPGDRGLTLIEVIVAIVVIGIAVPVLIVPFSGLKDTKNPEYVVQASYLAQQQMESIADKAYADLPAAGSYTCSQFQASVSSVDCSSAQYSFSWLLENVNATSPNTAIGSPGFGKKVTLTVSRVDGAMAALTFYSLF